MRLTAASQVRVVVAGLLLAAVSAGSLIAFSLLAGHTDAPLAVPVVVQEAPTTATPVTLAAPAPVPPQVEVVRPDVASIVDEPVTDVVLGTRIRNRKTNATRATEPRPAITVAQETVAECACRRAKKSHSPNGHAYGYYKTTPRGNAYGHHKTTRPGNAYGHHEARPARAKGPKKG